MESKREKGKTAGQQPQRDKRQQRREREARQEKGEKSREPETGEGRRDRAKSRSQKAPPVSKQPASPVTWGAPDGSEERATR